MADYVEVSEQGFFSRIADSIKGIFIGFMMFIIAFPLLFWNECNAVTQYKKIGAARDAVVSVASDKVDSGNEGKLIHTSGMVKVDETLTDAEFGVSVKGLALKREVEMYQWVEKKETKKEKKVGGKEKKTTSYNYVREWSSSLNKSDNFKSPDAKKKNVNPGAMPYEAKTVAAKNATMGAFTLTESIIGSISSTNPYPVTQEIFDKLPANIKSKAKLNGDKIYIGANPSDPQVGDVRISFAVAEPGEISVISGQAGNSFKPFKTDYGDYQMVSSGKKTSDEMFADNEAAVGTMTWVLRFVGFFLMFIGLGMIFKPLSVVADVIPFIGSIIGTMSTVVAFLIAAPLTFLTIAIAWIVARPLIGILMLLLAGGFIGGLVFLIMKARGGD
jgi:hypothetical protein